ncbi:potassium channel family protein [Halovenus marina]|uniref:potassium channel family protein n=1 Tax=Halovenus marina TaxID=3396621 RepID=UPI003F547808
MAAFDGDPGSETIEYEPVGVKDLLVAMKNSSELIVDLAYSALLNNSEQLATEVLELESQMDRLQMQARMNLLMAARNPQDSKQLAPVLGVVGATEKISNAAGDIAAIVLEETELPGAIRAALPEAMEVLTRATVDPGSAYADRSLGDIDLETETGVRVIALRSDDEWELDPDNETTLESGDVLLLRGAASNLVDVYETVTGEPYEQTEPVESEITDLDRAVDTIVLMKNVSELSVDLAYGSVLADDEPLAREVHSLEIEVDALQARLEAWTLQAAGEIDDPITLRGLLRLANSAEVISDAALEITEGILRDIDTHPVITESVKESDVAVRPVRIGAESPFVGADLGSILDTHAGVSVIAIHDAADEWTFYPERASQLATGDVVIARGTWNAIDDLLSAAEA